MNWPANRAHARKALSTLARPWTLRAHTQASHKYVSLSMRLSYIWCKHNRARTSQSTSQMQVLWLGLYTWLMLLSIKSLLFHQELCISFWYRQISSPRLCMTYIQCDHSPGWPNAGQVTACIVHRLSDAQGLITINTICRRASPRHCSCLHLRLDRLWRGSLSLTMQE